MTDEKEREFSFFDNSPRPDRLSSFDTDNKDKRLVELEPLNSNVFDFCRKPNSKDPKLVEFDRRNEIISNNRRQLFDTL